MSDYSTMPDADLNASLYDMSDDEPASTSTPDAGTEAATTPPGEEPGADEPPVDPPADEAGDPSDDDGPGDRKVALQKAREAERLAKAEAAAYKARVEAFEQQQAQAAEDARLNEAKAEYQRIANEEGQEAADAFEARWLAGEYKTQAERAEQEKVQIRIEASAEAFMAVTPDYPDRIQQLREVFGDQQLDAMAAQWAQQGLNPAQMAYNISKERFPTEADLEARINERVAAKLKEAQSKEKTPSARGHETIAHISSGTQAPVSIKPARKMSDAELNRSLEE